MQDEIAVLTEYIRSETGVQSEIDADTDLLKSAILDSFSIVALAMFAQERFGIEFDPDDLTRDNLARLSSLAALIQRRRDSRAA